MLLSARAVTELPGGEGRLTMTPYRSRAATCRRGLRLALLTAVGVFLVLVVAVEASGRLPGGPNIPTQATTSTTQTTTPTTVRFSFSENGQRSLGKGRELTRASGSGTLTLAEPPTEPGTTYSSTSATGVITFHRWRVVGHR